MCGTDLCNKDFDTAAAKGHFDDDGDDLYKMTIMIFMVHLQVIMMPM